VKKRALKELIKQVRDAETSATLVLPAVPNYVDSFPAFVESCTTVAHLPCREIVDCERLKDDIDETIATHDEEAAS
jgi:hypothetical protein